MRARLPNRLVLVLLLSVPAACADDAAAPPSTTTTTAAPAESAARVDVFGRGRLGPDVLLLGAPFGVEDRGVLLTIDLATGAVQRAVTDGSAWPPGFKEPTTDPDHPDAEAASRSPDGQHVAVFTRSDDTRRTGITIITGDSERFHHLQSVATVVGGRLAWTPRSDAVYLLAASADGEADRVIGVPVGGRPYTVARLDERGFTWLAVR